MARDSEKSDDELLTTLGARAAGSVCRQRFGWGKKKICTRPKGHKGGHRQ
jgi:hypothetical protein